MSPQRRRTACGGQISLTTSSPSPPHAAHTSFLTNPSFHKTAAQSCGPAQSSPAPSSENPRASPTAHLRGNFLPSLAIRTVHHSSGSTAPPCTPSLSPALSLECTG